MRKKVIAVAMGLSTFGLAPGSMLLALIALLFALCASASAQQPGKIFWIGFLAGEGSAPSKAFVQGLQDLGYVEGKNIAFVFRSTEGKSGRYADLAAELVRLKVDIILADGTSPAQAAKKATTTIPIVMTSGTDPVRTGLVASLARPGGNVTGLTSITAELGGQLVELLNEVVPKLARVAILRPGGAADELFVKETEPPARALGVQLISLVVQGPDDFEDAFRSMTKKHSQALVMRLPERGYSNHFKRVVDLTVKNRLPAISPSTTWADAGGLIAYGSDPRMRDRRAAVYVDKILKGTKPLDLPVEAPMKFDLAINLKTAKQIGLAIPPNVLARADRVIR